MAGLSRSVWNLRQQFTSDDLQTAVRLLGRDVLDALRFPHGGRAVVLGGLELELHPGGVRVLPGAIVAPYAAGAGSAPRPDESAYVLGRNGAATLVPISAPVSESWSLLQARPIEITTSGDRSIYQPAIKDFALVNVPVQRDQALEFAIKVGGAAVPAPDLGWVPLHALRNQSGRVEPDTAYDLRPLPAHFAPALGTECFLRHDYRVTARSPAVIAFDVELVNAAGIRLSAQLTTTLSAILAPGYTPLANSWVYVYLAPWRGLPVGAQGARGMLVATGVAPATQGGRGNSLPITSPVPHGVTIAAGEATCIGALRTGDSGTALLRQSCTRGRHEFPTPDLSAVVVGDTIPPNLIPKNARILVLRAEPGDTETDTLSVGLWSPSAIVDPVADAHCYAAGSIASVGGEMPPLDLTGANAGDIGVSGLPGSSVLRVRSLAW